MTRRFQFSLGKAMAATALVCAAAWDIHEIFFNGPHVKPSVGASSATLTTAAMYLCGVRGGVISVVAILVSGALICLVRDIFF